MSVTATRTGKKPAARRASTLARKYADDVALKFDNAYTSCAMNAVAVARRSIPKKYQVGAEPPWRSLFSPPAAGARSRRAVRG